MAAFVPRMSPQMYQEIMVSFTLIITNPPKVRQTGVFSSDAAHFGPFLNQTLSEI
jgi:hypothetical protein